MNVICVLIAIGVVKSAAADVVTPANRTKFEAFIFKRCNQHSTDLVAYDRIKDHLDRFTDYFKLAFSHLPHDKQDFCNEDKKILVESMKSLATDIKPCLPKDEKYLPGFIYDSFAEFYRFLCSNNSRNIDNFFSTASKECLAKLKQQAAGDQVSHCFKKIIAPFDGEVKKDRLCGDLDTAKKCFSTAITKNCPEVPAFEALNSRFFKAISEPCGASTWVSGINSLVLLASIFMHKMIT